MNHRRRYLQMLFSILFAFALPAFAVPTKIKVRAVSRDAKIIGTHVGGARITIRAAKSRRILASGLQQGETGDTKKIMVEPRARGTQVYDGAGAAEFVATLDIDEPTAIEVTAEGPLGFPQALQRASKTLLVLPGKDIAGEGVLLEIHGFIVDITEPDTPKVAGGPISVRAKVTMTCGCPTEPGGLWDASKIEIVARMMSRDRVVATVPMEYAGERSTYRATLERVPAGKYRLEVIASDPANANAGMAKREIRVR